MLTQALINYDTEKAKTEIHKLTDDLKPNVSKKDEFGHQTNLLTLIDRINDQCDKVNASLICYVCNEIKTINARICLFIRVLVVKKQVRMHLLIKKLCTFAPERKLKEFRKYCFY